jgi:hypothetical protein
MTRVNNGLDGHPEQSVVHARAMLVAVVTAAVRPMAPAALVGGADWLSHGLTDRDVVGASANGRLTSGRLAARSATRRRRSDHVQIRH